MAFSDWLLKNVKQARPISRGRGSTNHREWVPTGRPVAVEAILDAKVYREWRGEGSENLPQWLVDQGDTGEGAGELLLGISKGVLGWM
jgi:hypothetical protein